MGEVARIQTAVAVPDTIDLSVMEKVMVQGDLAKLTGPERLNFYGSLCKSLGLNPLTSPFEYLNLNNKLRLYAKKECTEQLRMLRNVSVQITAREVVEGCYVVTARATLPNGRQDESTGAVALGDLKGEARANAMMKAETKAKRRVTLSICGLAFLDESELESVRAARHVNVNHETGEIQNWDPNKPPKSLMDHPEPAIKKRTTPFNILEEFAILKKRYSKLGKEDVYYTILPKYDVEKSSQFQATEQGKNSARACYRELRAVVEGLEADAALEPEAPAEKLTPPKKMEVVADWADLSSQPDWVEVGGIIHHYNFVENKYEPWIPRK